MSGADTRTRGQRMAGVALARVEAVAGNTGLRKEYKTRALGFPALVMQSGLAQAVGFLRAKGNNGYLDDLAAVMTKKDAAGLHATIIHAPMLDYRFLTREALDAAGWIKRFSQTLLHDDKEDEA